MMKDLRIDSTTTASNLVPFALVSPRGCFHYQMLGRKEFALSPEVLSSLRARPRSTKPVSFIERYIERKDMQDEIPSNDIDKHVTHHYAENNGVHIHYASIGKGPLIVMIHGFPDFWYTWRNQMVQAVIHHLKRDKAIIIGHDWGGGIAWIIAIGRLIILNCLHPTGITRELAHNPQQQEQNA